MTTIGTPSTVSASEVRRTAEDGGDVVPLAVAYLTGLVRADLDMPDDEVLDTTGALDDVGVDSLSLLALVDVVSEDFGVTFDPADFDESLTCIEDLAVELVRRLGAGTAGCAGPPEDAG